MPQNPFETLLSELRRRRVVRAGIVYGIAGWAIAQIVSTLAPVLLLPDWFPRAVVLLLILGFPVAVGLAWAFDVTAQGIRRTPAAAAVEAPVAARPHPFRHAALGALAMLVLVAGYARLAPSAGDGRTGAEAEAAIRSLAVLPFADMSPAGDQRFFSDGVSEELLNLLARLPGLQVAARTSSFAFGTGAEDVTEIGRRLNVEAVLEGSVRRDGDRIRVTAQLIDAATGFHLWSENYDRAVTGVLALQDDIARAIVEALRLRLVGGGAAGPAPLPTGAARADLDPETHTLYLRGLHHWHRRRVEDFHLAIDYFQRAIARDPTYAAAHAGLALAQVTLTGYDNDTLDEMLGAARSAARRALELDPDLPDAHAALALIALRDLDWDGAERHSRRALELNPNHIAAHHWLSQHLVAMGRFDEALELARRAVALDPLSVIINNNLGFIHAYRGEYEAAARAYESTVKLDPSFPTGLSNLWSAYLRLGRYDDAEAALARLEAATPSTIIPLLRVVTEGARDPAARPAALAALDELARRPRRSAWSLAGLYMELGEVDRAIEWLERAHAERHYNVPYTAVSPVFRPLHGHPRYEALIRAAGLTGVARRP